MAKGVCADCGGFDIEWMRRCSTHNVEYCRGCDCPWCVEDALDEYEDDGPLELEDQLERALDKEFPGTSSGDPK